MGQSNSITTQRKHVRFSDQDELSRSSDPQRIMRICVHSINNIIRSTDIGSEVDPFVEIRANDVLLGATEPKRSKTITTVEQSFHVRTERSPENMILKFYLKDRDYGSEDDMLGGGYFDLAEEDSTLKQTVYMKWRGKEIANIVISVDFHSIAVLK